MVVQRLYNVILTVSSLTAALALTGSLLLKEMMRLLPLAAVCSLGSAQDPEGPLVEPYPLLHGDNPTGAKAVPTSPDPLVRFNFVMCGGAGWRWVALGDAGCRCWVALGGAGRGRCWLALKPRAVN